MDRTSWALAFVGTLLVETPVYWLALRRALGLWGALSTSLLVNLVTHPLAWSAVTGGWHPWPWFFLAVEAGVTLVEALLVFAVGRTRLCRRDIPIKEALAISVVANGLSAGIGLLV